MKLNLQQNKEFLDNLERSAQFSYSTQYFWWKKNNTIKKFIKKYTENLNTGKTLRILDIGCQIGHDIFSSYNTINNKSIAWYGIDIDKKSISIADMRKKLREIKNVHFINGDVTNLPVKKNYFDLILCSEVFEHIENSETVLKELNILLKSNGILIFSTPNNDNKFLKVLKTFNKLFCGKLKKHYKNFEEDEKKIRRKIDFQDEYEHINVKTVKHWVTQLKSAGFKVSKIKKGTLLYGTKFLDDKPLLFSLYILLDLLLDNISFLYGFSYHFFVICKK